MIKMMKWKTIISLLVILATFNLFPTRVTASTIQKCYTISSGNTIVYSDTSLRHKYGTIYGSDEVVVRSVNKTYCEVTYPISGGRTKTGYIHTSAILCGTSGQTYKSRAKIITYKRPSGLQYGFVSKGDLVTVLGTYGSYTQVKYPVSGGHKYAFITTRDFKAHLAPGNVQIPEPPRLGTGWQMPMAKAYVCGNGWLTYYRKRLSRPYHLGLDLASRTGDENVYAVADGEVAATGYNKANGYYVIIRHKLNRKTVYSFYCHLRKRSIAISSGKTVSRGRKIGIYGNTGSVSQGIHLHFAIVNKLWSGGGYYGYGDIKTGNKVNFNGVIYYNPAYVIKNGKLP